MTGRRLLLWALGWLVVGYLWFIYVVIMANHITCEIVHCVP